MRIYIIIIIYIIIYRVHYAKLTQVNVLILVALYVCNVVIFVQDTSREWKSDLLQVFSIIAKIRKMSTEIRQIAQGCMHTRTFRSSILNEMVFVHLY